MTDGFVALKTIGGLLAVLALAGALVGVLLWMVP